MPDTRLKTPSGKSAAAIISAKMKELSGATSVPLSTTVQPAASAAPAFMQTIRIGPFQGVIAPTTPAGSRATTVCPTRSSQTTDGRLSAMLRRSSTAASA